jgi:hypothetical protein
VKITAEPRSDQWNADDFIGGPRTFTIAGVKVGAAEQKYDIDLVEGEGRVWRPPLTMLRLLIAAWGDDAKAWTGRRVRLYRDASIKFGSDAVGGIRVSHMSDLPGGKSLTVKLTATRGRRAPVSVEPLPDDPADGFAERISAAATLADLETIAADLKSRDLGSRRNQLLAAYSERKAALSQTDPATESTETEQEN